MHGKTSSITHNYQGIFKNIPNSFKATRYHSLAVDVTVYRLAFLLMHGQKKQLWQFHIVNTRFLVYNFILKLYLSQYGMQLLENFLNYETQPLI